MRMSRYLIPTLKEDPADAVITSHKLMIRAGLIRKESAGMYIYLPLGLRVLQKIIDIIREEMNKAGALEFLMPELTNADLWKESGRWHTMGPEMIRIKDRNGLEYALAPTHEEAFTNAIRMIVTSYRDLPVNAYQINTKFRDEIRPRFGVMRSKEFIMKDAYSFDIDEAGLERSYQIMRQTYRTIFKRCGLETIPVEADTGSMGGSDSEEFMVASEVGEEILLLCDACGYKSNQERATCQYELSPQKENLETLQVVDTPNVRTIDELVQFFGCSAHKFLKSLIYVADGIPVMAVVPGDREINEVKLKNVLGALELELAPDSVVEEVTGAPVGFAGPILVKGKQVRIIFDKQVKDIANAITGANEKDKHYQGVNPGRDFAITEEADITLVIAGDKCPHCGYPLKEKKGIEVGHIFKLGYKYTKSMNVTVLDQNGKAITPIMGCYGIGVNRTMAAVIEQHHDERGIIWPMSIAPFHVHLVSLAKNEAEEKAADQVYELLVSSGLEVLYDDRKASPGFKFGDADLIGIPIRLTLGKVFFGDSSSIEIKLRNQDDREIISKDNIVPYCKKLIADQLQKLYS
ncbi:MAG: proline--tRNA ligase [Spirochaetes bacterium]|nr:proline--tRNA ligase [Spirochaetota bacterium]